MQQSQSQAKSFQWTDERVGATEFHVPTSHMWSRGVIIYITLIDFHVSSTADVTLL